MRTLNSATLIKKPLLFGARFCHISRVIANFVLKFPISSYHGNNGRSPKIPLVRRSYVPNLVKIGPQIT